MPRVAMSPSRRLVGMLSTSIGRKLLVALTGIALIGFLVAHLLGNLLIFQGRDAMNAYALWLKSNPLLWAARAGLVALFAVHLGLALALARENRAARPVRYARRIATPGTRRSSRFTVVTGLTILAFVVFHLFHFTIGVVEPEGYRLVDRLGRHDVFGMVVHGFSQPWIVATYVVAMLLLGVHLHHGALSALETLGFANPTSAPLARLATNVLIAGLVAGNVALPLLVLFGFTGPAEVP